MQILSDATITHSTDDDFGRNGMLNRKDEILYVNTCVWQNTMKKKEFFHKPFAFVCCMYC